ncbi:MAG: helix-turn-helix domain-containing protein [Acidimicrobiales bacterium]
MAAAADVPLDERIVEAALECIARWGIAKTTLDDVARQAGCGRATIYRTFSGGKAAVLAAVVRREIARLAAAVDAAVTDASSLEDLLVAGAVAGARFVHGHDALAFLLAHEAEAVLPHIAFDRRERLFTAAAAFAAPHLARFVPEADAPAAAEWVTRVVLSYALNPSERVDLADEADARRFVTTYLVPAVQPRLAPARS